MNTEVFIRQISRRTSQISLSYHVSKHASTTAENSTTKLRKLKKLLCALSFFFFVFSHFFFVSMAKALLLSGTDTRALMLNLSSRADASQWRRNFGERARGEPTSRRNRHLNAKTVVITSRQRRNEVDDECEKERKSFDLTCCWDDGGWEVGGVFGKVLNFFVVIAKKTLGLLHEFFNIAFCLLFTSHSISWPQAMTSATREWIRWSWSWWTSRRPLAHCRCYRQSS